MKTTIVLGVFLTLGMLLLMPAIPAVEWNECKQSIHNFQGDALQEKIQKALETNDYPILTQILIRIISSMGSKIIGKLTQNKVVLGLMLQLVWLMIVRNIITPMLTGTE